MATIGMVKGVTEMDTPDLPTQQGLLTLRDAALYLNVSEKTLSRLSAPKGDIAVVRIGKRGVRYTATALNQWIVAQEAASLGVQR
jgi:excisionase family DNA binding protein